VCGHEGQQVPNKDGSLHERRKLDETASAIQGPHGKGKIDFFASRKKSSVKDLDKKTEANGFLSSITHGANELASSVRGQMRKRHQLSILY
jgi:hypothetical protein